MISRRIARIPRIPRIALAHRSAAVLLAAVTVLPVVTATSATADPAPPAPAPASGPEAELVPGVYQPWQIDTPDQVLAPQVYTPSAKEDAVEPAEAAPGTYDLVEYVPLADAVARVSCTKSAGPFQRQVERWLKRKVDGKQSKADCKAIRAFQVKQKIKPAIGFAGPVTWARMQYLSAKKNPNASKKCPVRSYRVACVDLNRQITWVQKGEKVVYGPVPMRSGRAGYRTRTGWFKVYWKHKNHVSTLYHQPMPYAQFFSGGQAFHAVYGSIFTTVGSMGCVNLRIGDARKLWGVLKKGDRVYVWGRRAGA
ncbi:L,D-transpeptidase [Streptomyces sp. NPDC046909]|uniref:L,D-transpeptidase family protein n=1 Tax=Streptomyces sp. NPDC046909 TaxID=3155617 RepID=UPI0033DB20A2